MNDENNYLSVCDHHNNASG